MIEKILMKVAPLVFEQLNPIRYVYQYQIRCFSLTRELLVPNDDFDEFAFTRLSDENKARLDTSQTRFGFLDRRYDSPVLIGHSCPPSCFWDYEG